MEDSPFGELPPERVEVSRSVVRSLSGGNVNVQMSAVNSVLAAQAGIQQSVVLSVKGQAASMSDSLAGSVVAREMSLENCKTLFLISPSVKGNVRAAVTLPAAVALGFGFFWARWLAGRLGHLLKG
ncbi:MAG: hypothetical protein ABR978_02880 [Dehalococcoidia bacterium]|jgi:hypothetical protein